MSVFLEYASGQFSSVKAGWEVAWSLDANLNPDFNLQNPLFFVVAVGLWCYNPGKARAIASSSEGLLDLDTNRNPRQLMFGIELKFSVSFGMLIQLRSTCLDGMGRPGVRISFFGRNLCAKNSTLKCLRVSTVGPLWLHPFGNAFLAN